MACAAAAPGLPEARRSSTILRSPNSDWLAAGDYAYPQYCADMTNLIARSGATTVDWVGTSMGGLVATRSAGQFSTK